MAVYDVWLSRNNGVTLSSYVGHKGRLFYDEDEKVLRYSDGVTPGGFQVVPITTTVSTTEPTNVPEGAFWLNPDTLALWCYHNGTFIPTIDTATTTKIGGIKLGPGVTVNGQGQLVIDTSGLDFAFGDFYAFTNLGPHDGACLSSINANQDIVFVSNGTGGVHVVGSFDIHQTDATVEGALSAEPIFSVNANGNVRVLAPNSGGTSGAFQIVGNSTGAEVAPNQTGVVVHITGNQDMVSRNYFDGVNNYALLAGRRYNGTPLSPVNVKSGELFFRIAGQASTGTGFETFGPCQIDWVATENQGPNNQGGELRIRATPNGSSALAGITQVAAFNATTGVTAIKFNGPLTGNVTGNVSGNAGTVTNGVYTTDTGTVTNTMLAGSIANNKLSNSSITVNGTSIALGASATVTAAAGTLTGTTLNSTVVTSSLTSVGTLTGLTVNGTGAFTKFTGKFIRNLRDAGTIADNGTLTIDFSTDAVVSCVWGNGMTIAYQNYTAGSVVKVLATKSTGTGTDTLSLGTITATHTSSGQTTINYTADLTAFIEFTCVGTTIGSVYAKF